MNCAIRVANTKALITVCPCQQFVLGLKYHLKDWKSSGLNPRPLVFKASSFITTKRRLLKLDTPGYLFPTSVLVSAWDGNAG